MLQPAWDLPGGPLSDKLATLKHLPKGGRPRQCFATRSSPFFFFCFEPHVLRRAMKDVVCKVSKEGTEIKSATGMNGTRALDFGQAKGTRVSSFT